MPAAPTAAPAARSAAKDLGRALGGSTLFGLPLLMTMEVWEHALTMPASRVALLVAAALAFLVALSQLSGFGDVEGQQLADFVVDALVAIAVGAIVSLALLAVFGVLDPDLGIAALARRVALGAVPASLGAAFARSQLTQQDQATPGGDVEGYGQELLLMVAGAVLVSFNIAPTQEVPLIAFQAGPVGALAIVVVSLVAMHALVYAVGFAGSHDHDVGVRRTMVRFTLVGYLLVLGTCAVLLWAFGRADAVPASVFAREVVVLGLPAALGAAVARLVL